MRNIKQGAITRYLNAPSRHAPDRKTFVDSQCLFVLMPDGHLLFQSMKRRKKILKIPSFRPQASTGPGRIFGLRCFHLPVKWGT
jgi:hypothetical protein